MRCRGGSGLLLDWRYECEQIAPLPAPAPASAHALPALFFNGQTLLTFKFIILINFFRRTIHTKITEFNVFNINLLRVKTLLYENGVY